MWGEPQTEILSAVEDRQQGSAAGIMDSIVMSLGKRNELSKLGFFALPVGVQNGERKVLMEGVFGYVHPEVESVGL